MKKKFNEATTTMDGITLTDKTVKLQLDSSLDAKDCFDGLAAEADDNRKDGSIIAYGCRIVNYDDYLIIESPDENKVNRLIFEIEKAYNVVNVQDLDVPDDVIDYSDSYEMDSPTNPTWKENTKMKLSFAKKLLRENGYTVRRPMDEMFDYDTASPEDQMRYDNAVSKLQFKGAARPFNMQSGEPEWDDDGFATDFKQKGRFLRVAINDDFKKDMNQKYGYPPQELVQLASQALDSYLQQCAGTPDPEEFRAFVEENVL